MSRRLKDGRLVDGRIDSRKTGSTTGEGRSSIADRRLRLDGFAAATPPKVNLSEGECGRPFQVYHETSFSLWLAAPNLPS